MEIKEKKNTIRKQLKSKRSSMDLAEVNELSHIICNNIINSQEYAEATNILCYMVIKNEVIVNEVIEKALFDGKKVYLPKVSGKDMTFYEIHSLSDCMIGAYNILEPRPVDPFTDENGVVVVPGVGFNKKLQRIGYGAGYYDRYFANKKNLIKIAAAYELQITDEEFEEDIFDIPMDYIYTENNIYGGAK